MIDDPNQYYYVNGKISTCRRCKRKRTLDEDPQHLQFKTCYRCRMIERDQKKFNQARRKLNADSSTGSRTTPPTHEEIAQLAEFLKSTTKPVQPTTSASTPQSKPNTAIQDSLELKQYIPNQVIQNQSTAQMVDLNKVTQYIDPTLSLLDSDLNEDSWESQFEMAYNEQLFSFNILSIDPKLNPLTLSMEQQSLLQLSFLSKYQHEHSLTLSPHSLAPTDGSLCFGCKSSLPSNRLSMQLCSNCENKQSTIKDFNLFLTILKLNLTQDLYRVLFVTNLPLDKLVKSSLSRDKSKDNILKLLYQNFILPINDTAGSEFVLPSSSDNDIIDDHHNKSHLISNSLSLTDTISPAATMTPNLNSPDGTSSSNSHFKPNHNDHLDDSNSFILKKILKCACDNSMESFAEAAIDPEALELQNDDHHHHINTSSIECKFSQLCLSYDLKSGDFVISLSHSCHR